MDEYDGYFKITSIHRDDFESRGYDASNVTDEQMRRVATKMADSYLECCFWVAVDYWAEELKLSSKEQD